MKLVFLIIIIFAGFPEIFSRATAATSTSEESATEKQIFDLKKSILFAVENSPSFDSLKRTLSIADLEEQSAAAKLLPSLDLSATHGISDTDPRTTASPWSSELKLELTESIYDNGVMRMKHRIAILAKNQAGFNFEDQKNKISLEIASQFITYSLNVKQLEIQENKFKLVRKQYDMISKNYYQGIKTKKDFLGFRTLLSRSEIDWFNAKSAVEKSKEDLQKLIGGGLKARTEFDFTPLPLDSINSKTPAIKLEIKPETTGDFENHPQYRATQIQKEINQINSQLVAKKNLPEWFLSTGLNYGSSNYLGTGKSFSDNAQLGWNALLTVKYNFFDWGIRSRDREIAIQKNNIQNNGLDLDLLSLKSTLNQLQINRMQTQKNFELAKELLLLEKINIEFIEREYRNGKVQYLDLITSLNNLSDAEIKFYSALSSLQTTKYTLLYHQGKLYEDLLK